MKKRIAGACVFRRALRIDAAARAQNRGTFNKETEAFAMRERHSLIPYALEAVARPGSREICVRRPPDGFRIRNERGDCVGKKG